MALEDWSPTASENALVLGINIGENCPAANMNNAARQMMADVAGGINMSVLGSFLASTSLSQARSALGVTSPTSSTGLTNFGNLTNSANKVPYMTGSDGWATTDFPSFGRSLVGCGDAASALTLLGISGGATSSISASSGYVTFTFSGTIFKLVWKDATITGETSNTVTYPSAFTSWSRAWCNGGTSSPTAEQNDPFVSGSSTTSATVYCAHAGSYNITVFAIGV